MEYKELSKVYYADASTSRDIALTREYERRFNADSTFRLGFAAPQGELFLATPRELAVLSEKILRTERKISNMVHNMPDMASHAVLRGLVLDEVVCSNAIEDIHSTRKQIQDALDAPQSAPGEAKRFRELAMLYLSIIDGKAATPTSPEDVRAIYDSVIEGELAPDKKPDGTLFRAQGVEIIQGGGRTIHQGIEPESAITEAIGTMLRISQSDEIPALYRSVVAHYLFEYIHPFYDGNGRTGRFLLSLMLNESLSSATALSLSRIIAEYRDTYYRAFRSAEKPLNHGELTFFVLAILELIRDAQLQLEEKLAHNTRELENIRESMGDIVAAEGLREQEAQIVYMLMLDAAFSLPGGAPLATIATHLGLKDQMTRKHLAALERKGIVEKRRKRNPVTFALTKGFASKWNRGSE